MCNHLTWEDVLAEPTRLGPPPRVVSDELFQIAFENEQNRRVAYKCVQRYAAPGKYLGLDQDQLEQVVRSAFFFTLMKHDFARSQFTSSLWFHTRTQALQEIRLNKLSSEQRVGQQVHYESKELSALLNRSDPVPLIASRENVRQLLSFLPEEQALLVRLHVIEGWNYQELARKGFGVGKSVEKKISEGLSTLREHLRQHHPEEELKWTKIA